jgi:hypothetical protein
LGIRDKKAIPEKGAGDILTMPPSRKSLMVNPGFSLGKNRKEPFPGL